MKKIVIEHDIEERKRVWVHPSTHVLLKQLALQEQMSMADLIKIMVCEREKAAKDAGRYTEYH